MILLKALEAKSMSARTFSSMVSGIFRSVNNFVFASLVGAPLEKFALVCKLLDMPLYILLAVIESIFFVFFLGKVFHEETIWYNNIAIRLLAIEKHALWISERLLEIVLPAYGVKLVTANQRFSLILCIIFFELCIANRAKTLIFISSRVINIWVELFNLLIKLQSYLILKLLLIFKPLLFHLLLIPVEMS